MYPHLLREREREGERGRERERERKKERERHTDTFKICFDLFKAEGHLLELFVLAGERDTECMSVPCKAC